MQPLEFLRRILPDDGICCAVTFKQSSQLDKNGNPKTIAVPRFFNAPADLVEHSAAQHGKDFYHAVASYNEPGERKKSNVNHLKCLWLDIDVRENKAKTYKTMPEAFAGIHKFLQDTSLPEPLIVFTGRGLHLYWPLDTQLSLDEWQPLATGLKLLTAGTGILTDPGITADAARILRTPGTINIKNGQTCRALNDVGPYPLSAFNILRMQKEKVIPKGGGPLDKPKPDAIIAQCRQMRLFSEGVHQTGETWIACGRVLAQTTGGEELFFKYSQLDPRYNEDEARKKWAESVAFGNAIKCDRFTNVNPDGCAGCPHLGKITTPIVLGRNERGVEQGEEVKTELDASAMPAPSSPHHDA